MASYNARIDLDVSIDKALSQIKKVESAIDRLSGIGSAGKEFKEALIPDVKAFRTIERELSNIKNRANSTAKVFARIFEGVSTAGVAGAGLQALNAEMFKLAQSTGTAAASIQELDKNTGGLSRFIPGFTALKDTVGASAQEVNKLQFNLQNFLNNTEGLREFVNKFYTMQGAAGAATAGLLALAGVLEGQLRESLGDIEQVSSKALGGLAEDAAKGTSELQRLINATQGTAKQYRNLIQVGEERRDSFNSASREARQATNTIVQAEKKLTDELRAQADLLRQVRGFTVENVATGEVRTLTELEATKGRQSIQTRQNAEAFRLKQLSEQEAVYQAIAKLNERDGTALQEKLGVQRNITNQVTLEAQRREEVEQRAATGLSRRIPTPYRTAGSMGFPVALPEIEQDRRLRAREERRKAALSARQGEVTLSAQGVTALKLEQALIERLNELYRVYNLRRKNARQSQLFRARSNRAQRQELGGENLQRLERVNKLATNNVLKEKLKNKVALAGNAIKKNEFIVAKKIGREIDRSLKAENKRIDRARRVLRLRQRERKETRAIAKNRARSRKEALGSGIIGGAFPLLFGQGIGAAVGGGAGGAAGGLAGGQFGFALSLVGTALGQGVDDFIASTTKLAQSLKSPAESLEALGEAGLNVDESSKMLVKSLLESGKAVEAQQVAFDEINKTLGPNAVKRLTAFDEQSKRIQTAFGEMSAELQSELAPYLITATYLVANMAESLKILTKVKLPWWLDLALRATPVGFAMGAAKDVGNSIAEQTKEPLVQDKTLEQRRKDYQLRKTFNQEELQYRKESTSLLGRELELLKMTGAEDKYRRSTLQAQLNVDQQRLAVRKATDAVNRAGGDVSAEISARKQQFAASDALKRAEAEAEVARAAERVFNFYSKQADTLQQVVTASKLRLNNEQAIAEARNKFTGAYYNAELKIKDLAIQRAKQRGDANAVLQLELDKVQLIYRQTIAQIQAEVERTRLKYRQVQLATRELEVANLRKKAEGKLQQADVDAMKVQQQALKIAGNNVSVSEQVASQQIRGAQAVAVASQEALRYSYNQNKAADAAERTARAQERGAKAIARAGASAGAEPVDAFPNPKMSFIQDPRRTKIYLSPAEEAYVKRLVKAGILPEYQAKTTRFAEGGYVTRPTKAFIGEAGENEYVIPESKMNSAIKRYTRGERGESIVEGGSETGGGGKRTPGAVVNISTGPVMRMNNKNYVTVNDLNNAVGSVVAAMSELGSSSYGNGARLS